jgi:hypothetical protein
MQLEEARRLPLRVSNSTYEKHVLPWGGTFRSRKSIVYTKRSENNGILVICGLRVNPSGLPSVLEDKWFAQAKVIIDDIEIVQATFVYHQPKKFIAEGDVAGCVSTGWPATEALMTKQLYFSGATVRESVD